MKSIKNLSKTNSIFFRLIPLQLQNWITIRINRIIGILFIDEHIFIEYKMTKINNYGSIRNITKNKILRTAKATHIAQDSI